MNATKIDGSPPAALAGDATARAMEASPFYSAGDVHILVIDDDPAIGRLVQAAFAAHDFHIDVVSDPSLVDAALRQQQYPVIILDYVLPGLDSVQVMQSLRELQADASIVVITAYPSIDSALTCLRAQTYDYLTKTFQLEQ